MLSSLWYGLIASGNVIMRNEHNSRIQCYVWHKVHNILRAPWRHISISLLPPSGDQGIGLVWDNHPTTLPTLSDILVWVLKSFSNWTKLYMIGIQLFSGWYQMILEFSDVLSCFLMFSAGLFTLMDDHFLCGHFFSWCPQLITDILQRFSDAFKMCSDVHRCFQVITDVFAFSLDAL